MATLTEATADIRVKRGLDEAPAEEAVVEEPVGAAEVAAEPEGDGDE
jgi:pyrroline-5-carboxylate reductase